MLEAIGLLYIIGMVVSFFLNAINTVLVCITEYDESSKIYHILPMLWILFVTTLMSWPGFLLGIFFCFAIIEDWPA